MYIHWIFLLYITEFTANDEYLCGTIRTLYVQSRFFEIFLRRWDVQKLMLDASPIAVDISFLNFVINCAVSSRKINLVKIEICEILEWSCRCSRWRLLLVCIEYVCSLLLRSFWIFLLQPPYDLMMRCVWQHENELNHTVLLPVYLLMCVVMILFIKITNFKPFLLSEKSYCCMQCMFNVKQNHSLLNINSWHE